ncbi:MULTISPECIES: NADH-quinone oxidoreductase subunit NuoK [Persicobacter]|uniref:NADH-quinone oxidoreductase subunit K n=1 Tax=Persicobacter diffluens TaxID=981 RepID=A0AAN4VXU3_9BACT|nr:NADH-quinone oxidoreductase subunit NuoK [Persicobacter sp. CCB-QB2]GJM60780.1 NADH-quinone oxidoreductase subunit K [Persicobacter diffluens]
MIPISHILILSAILFAIGLMIILMKKNAIVVLMGVELILNAANLNMVAFSQYDPSLKGQMFSMFVMVIAVSEIAIALAIVFKLYHHLRTVDIDFN